MTPQCWLITGGAGFIGSHIADVFLSSGKDLVIIDSLFQGLESRIEFLRKKHNKKIPLIVADIRDTTKLSEVLMFYKPYGIIHTAALKSVSESIEKPDEYFEVNTQATTKLLELASLQGIKNFIFSSTAAVYGSPNHSSPVTEAESKNPISAYGDSKLAAEREVEKYLSIPGNHGTSLRFFNVIGTTSKELMDNSIENLVPIVINKLKIGQAPVIYGTDYSTADGSCVRDYIDVRDIARAHLAAADSSAKLPLAMNVGTSRGGSVREIISLIGEAFGRGECSASEVGRRAGDPAFLCADVSLIMKVLGFTAQYTLEDSIKSLF